MKKILVDQCLQCWHCDDDTYHCRETGEKMINPYVIPADCPLEDDLPESKGSDGWIPVSRIQEGIDEFEKLRDECSKSNDSVGWTHCLIVIDTLQKLLPAVPQEKGDMK